MEGIKSGDTLKIYRYGEKVNEYKFNVSSPNVYSTTVPDLGKFTKAKNGTFALTPKENEQYRIVNSKNPNIMIDNIPRYVRESKNIVRTKDSKLVSDYISKHPLDSFIVIVTVPSYCPPCRTLDHTLSHLIKEDNFDSSLEEENVKVFILEQFDFQSGKENALGEKGIFPSLLVYNNAGEDKEIITPEVIGNLYGKMQASDAYEPVRERLGSGKRLRTVIRGLLSKTGLVNLVKRLRERR